MYEYTVSLGVPLDKDKDPAAPSRLVVTPLGDGRYQVQLGADGDTAVYDARAVARGAAYRTLSLHGADGGQAVVDVEGALPDLKVYLADGAPVALKLVDAQSLAAVASGAVGSGAKELKAPMPGKAVKVLCAPGQAVKAGQGLVIIEAMKMENELRAAADGVVHEVRVSEGQSVEGGAVLVVLA